MDDGVEIDYADVASALELTPRQVETVVSLLDEGNTVPFITRYRKEATGGMDEEQIRRVQSDVTARRQVVERSSSVLRLIAAQGRLTPELRQSILDAQTLKRLDDLYLPFRPRRRSRAQAARTLGLGPVAERIWNPDNSTADLASLAAACVDPERALPDTKAVLRGAADILAERIGEHPEARDRVRRLAWRSGQLRVRAASPEEGDEREFRDYRDYRERLGRVPPHRVLAINRGEATGALRVRIDWDDEPACAMIVDELNLHRHRFEAFLRDCVVDALRRLIRPSIEREIRRELTDRAEGHAVDVFVRNLRKLLMQPPLRGMRVVAIDPGLRSGCKLAALDEYGNYLGSDVVYITGSPERRETACCRLAEFLRTYECSVIAIGNGTACRETEELVAGLIERECSHVRYVIVNEAGASIYSAGSVARDEFPELDATVRGTISIGRRLQDPLSELVKIEARHLGVGMYQHDLDPNRLRKSLEQVIESCVNQVGVDLNFASASLLRHVSGLTQRSARRITQYRHENGGFRSRSQLLDVPGIGTATFTQAAGFLRINGGDNPLDATWIHPETYSVTRKLLDRLSLSLSDLPGERTSPTPIAERLSTLDLELVAEPGVGLPTIRDIVDSLLRPGLDPRSSLPAPVFKQGILRLSDLTVGMELTGTVLNVVDFGAFVDVGVKDCGLVHISRMSTSYVSCPHDVVSVGDVVTVWVHQVDAERHRVGLTLVTPSPERTEGGVEQATV